MNMRAGLFPRSTGVIAEAVAAEAATLRFEGEVEAYMEGGHLPWVERPLNLAAAEALRRLNEADGLPVDHPRPIGGASYEPLLGPGSYDAQRDPWRITARVIFTNGSCAQFTGPDALAQASRWLAAWPRVATVVPHDVEVLRLHREGVA